MKSLRHSLLLLVVLFGISAGRRDPVDCIRRGNEAFAREDYAAAVDWYTQAEDTITDPGLAAFNKAAALFRMGDYALAEVHYLRAREGAGGERLARVLFDLGNTLLLRAGERDARLLGRAVDAYRACVAQPEAGENLRADARHNLEIAVQLWEKAKAADKSSSSNPNDPDNKRSNSQGADSRTHPDRNGNSAGTAQPGHGDPREAATSKNGEGEKPSATDTSPPGAGNLPLIPDEDRLLPLSPEETGRVLQAVADRVAKERRDHRQRKQPPSSPNTLDW